MGRKLVLLELRKILCLDFKYRLYVFSCVLLFLFFIPISFLEGLPNLSICSRILGDYCYSVGITRGVSSLLKGEIGLAMSYNQLSLVVLVIILSIILIDLKKKISK